MHLKITKLNKDDKNIKNGNTTDYMVKQIICGNTKIFMLLRMIEIGYINSYQISNKLLNIKYKSNLETGYK